MSDILQDAEPGQNLNVLLYTEAGVGTSTYVPPPTPEEEYWAGLIVLDLRSSIASIISAGLNLIAAKAALSHGSWLPMLALAGVGERKAQTLMQIARHPVLSDPQHVALLPTSWGTLSELAQLSDTEVLGALESGAVGPDTTRSEAAALIERDLDAEDDEGQVPDKAVKAQDYAEARDAAVFSVKQAVTRLADCLKLITSPGFRLTAPVAQDIYRELNKLDKVYGDLLLAVDEEVGSVVQKAPAAKPIPASSRPAPQAGNSGLKAGQKDVSLGGISDSIGDQSITLEQWKERQ